LSSEVRARRVWKAEKLVLRESDNYKKFMEESAKAEKKEELQNRDKMLAEAMQETFDRTIAAVQVSQQGIYVYIYIYIYTPNFSDSYI